MSKHKRYRDSDPTSSAAIGNVDRERKHREQLRGQKRPILEHFPAEFAGLLPMEARKVALRALTIAGNDVWAIKAHHVNQARREVIDGPGDAA